MDYWLITLSDRLDCDSGKPMRLLCIGHAFEYNSKNTPCQSIQWDDSFHETDGSVYGPCIPYGSGVFPAPSNNHGGGSHRTSAACFRTQSEALEQCHNPVTIIAESLLNMLYI